MTAEVLADVRTRRDQAEGRLAVIRNALAVADEELVRVLAERDWEVFDLPDFRSYCDTLLTGLQFIKLRTGPRRERIRKLLEQNPDLSRREAAAAAGCDVATAHRDMDWIKREGVANATPTPPLADLPTYWQVVHAIGKCGPAGGTTREVMKRLKWEQGPASAALSRAVKKGLLTATGERRHVGGSSPGFAVYVVAE